MANNVFWKNVKTLLKEKKLTQAALAKKCGVSLRTLENWIYRDIIPGLEDALYIAKALGVTAETLFFGSAPEGLSRDAFKIARMAEHLSANAKKEALVIVEAINTFRKRPESGRFVHSAQFS
jgi:transcriptional regulator with XRE-family HTH domain